MIFISALGVYAIFCGLVVWRYDHLDSDAILGLVVGLVVLVIASTIVTSSGIPSDPNGNLDIVCTRQGGQIEMKTFSVDSKNYSYKVCVGAKADAHP